MKNQTFGIEIEMNHISRAKAAEVIAAHFGNTPVSQEMLRHALMWMDGMPEFEDVE